MIAKLTIDVKEGSLDAPYGIHPFEEPMINPSWQDRLTVAATRRRVGLAHMGEPVTLNLFGDTTVGTVRAHHQGRDWRPNDVIWVKEMENDGITIRNAQFSPEGLPGVARTLVRVALIENAKGEGLGARATKLADDLKSLLEATDDKELGPLFDPHLAFVELFLSARPETAERLKNENPRKVQAMLERCLTLRDVTGRTNPHSKVLGVKSAQKRLRTMSARRMATANMALTTSLTLNALMDAMRALVTQVHAELTSKLQAHTWDPYMERQRRWMQNFQKRLLAWANEFTSMYLHPFAHDAQKVREKLVKAAALLQFGNKERIFSSELSKRVQQARADLEEALQPLRRLMARLNIAEMLQVVGTAKDPRIQQLSIAIEEPVWVNIQEGLEEARRTLDIRTPIPNVIPNSSLDGRIPFYYTALRATAAEYDTASRNAA